MGRPFANDHLDFFLSTRFFSIFLFIFSKFLVAKKTSSSPSKHFFFFQILGSRLNLADHSRKIWSCCIMYFTSVECQTRFPFKTLCFFIWKRFKNILIALENKQKELSAFSNLEISTKRENFFRKVKTRAKKGYHF